jgi:hypothetical protein
MQSPVLMSNSELIKHASMSATFVKAALVRSVLSADVSIGKNQTNTPQGVIVNETYTADFTDPKNLAFVDRFYIPKIKELVAEADKRGQTTAITQIFGPQALYAVQLGTVSSFTFNELSDILFPETVAAEPEPEAIGQVLAFPGVRRAN